MAHFAELDENNIVLRVVVVDDAHEADGENWCNGFFGTGNWKQTSYNTFAGVHCAPNTQTPDGGVAFRKNYAGIGYSYDPALDAFIPQREYDSWVLNTDTCIYEAPEPYPEDGNIYDWNESSGAWEIYDINVS